MLLSIWTEIGDFFVELGEDIKDFFLEHSRNPFLWIAIIIVGLLIFEFVYKTLNKEWYYGLKKNIWKYI